MILIHNVIRLQRLGSAIAVLVFSCVAAWGQFDGQLAVAQQQNAAQLRRYSWKMRTEVWKDGESKSVQVSSMKFDANGSPQPTQISSTQTKLPTGGLKGYVAKKKKEELVTILDALSGLAKTYSSIPANKMERFVANATIQPDISTQQSLIRIHGRNILQPDDSMTIWVDAATRRQRKVEIQTIYNNKPVRIVSEFRDLPDGPNYAARSVIEYATENLKISTENTEHRRER
ncbi:MAG: hypothetical protein ABL984_15845 [Pyrinomonadaceae bacterium]